MALLVSTRGDNAHVERGSVANFFFCSGLYLIYSGLICFPACSPGRRISKVGYHFQRDISQGHPMTVSCKLSVQGSKFWLEFSIA